jgi:ketosteroid isomerase-like protein
MIDTDANRTETALRKMMDDQATAMRSRDADYLTSRYAPAAVTFDLAPPLKNTAADVHNVETLRTWFAGFDGPIDYEIRDLDVTVDENTALCHSLNRLTATPKGTTHRFGLWFRSTVCWRKIGGTWQIIHEHNSTPFYMDGSLKAAVDLTP